MLITQAGAAAETAAWPGLDDLLGLRPEYSAAGKWNKNKLCPNAIFDLDSQKLHTSVPPYYLHRRG